MRRLVKRCRVNSHELLEAIGRAAPRIADGPGGDIARRAREARERPAGQHVGLLPADFVFRHGLGDLRQVESLKQAERELLRVPLHRPVVLNDLL